MKVFLLSLISFLILTGCSTNSVNIEASKNVNPISVKYQLYGRLKKVDDEYQFVDFSETYDKRNAWVRLSDLTPMWNTTTKEECLLGLASKKNVGCKTENEELFKFKGTDFTPTKTALYAVISVATFGLWLFLPPGSVEFDQDAYWAAAIEARNKLNGYESLLIEYSDSLTNATKRFDQLSSSYYGEEPKPKILLDDRSGLYANNIKSFRHLISVEENRYSSIDSIKGIMSGSLSGLVESVKTRNSKHLNEMEEGTKFYKVSCKKNGMSKVDYTIICPKKVAPSSGYFDVSVIVTGVNYTRVLPKKLFASDENVKLSLEDGVVKATNYSDDFIVVTDLSFYHAGKIATQHSIDLSLPPSSQGKLIDIKKMAIDWDKVSFYGLTKTQANRERIKYGFALRYSMSGRNTVETLYNAEYFKLADLVAEYN